MNKHDTLTSRQRVLHMMRTGSADRIPKGELCLTGSSFDEQYTLIQSLALDLVSLHPVYPCIEKRLPSSSEYLWTDVTKWVRETSLFTFAVIDGAFEWGMRILGIHQFCVMLKSSPLSLQELIQQVEKLNLYMVDKLTAEGVNGFILADDIAYQQSLFFSPMVLRTTFIPSLARQVDYIAGHDMPVFYHSDGNYSAVIEDIVRTGFTGLQCLEKNAGMDIVALQERFGKQLCLWGHLEVDDIEKAGNEAYLKQIIENTCSLVENGKLILGTTSGLFEGINITNLRNLYRSI